VNETSNFSVGSTVHNNVTVTTRDTGLGAPAATSIGPLAKVSYSNITLTDTNNSFSSPTFAGPVTKTILATCP